MRAIIVASLFFLFGCQEFLDTTHAVVTGVDQQMRADLNAANTSCWFESYTPDYCHGSGCSSQWTKCCNSMTNECWTHSYFEY